MLTLKKCEPGDDIFSPREWWTINNTLEVLVAFDNEHCSVNVFHREKGDSTKTAKACLKTEWGKDYPLTSTIDSWFFQCPRAEIEETLRCLEKSANSFC